MCHGVRNKAVMIIIVLRKNHDTLCIQKNRNGDADILSHPDPRITEMKIIQEKLSGEQLHTAGQNQGPVLVSKESLLKLPSKALSLIYSGSCGIALLLLRVIPFSFNDIAAADHLLSRCIAARKARRHLLQTVALQPVVAVEKAQIRSPALRDAANPGCHQPFVLLMNDMNPCILHSRLVTKRAASVPRAVVNQPQLQIPKGLGKNTVNALLQIVLSIVDGNNHPDQRRSPFHSVRCPLRCFPRRFLRHFCSPVSPSTDR